MKKKLLTKNQMLCRKIIIFLILACLGLYVGLRAVSMDHHTALAKNGNIESIDWMIRQMVRENASENELNYWLEKAHHLPSYFKYLYLAELDKAGIEKRNYYIEKSAFHGNPYMMLSFAVSSFQEADYYQSAFWVKHLKQYNAFTEKNTFPLFYKKEDWRIPYYLKILNALDQKLVTFVSHDEKQEIRKQAEQWKMNEQIKLPKRFINE